MKKNIILTANNEKKFIKYVEAIEIQNNFNNFEHLGKIILKCLTCSRDILLNGVASHSKICSNITKDKYTFLKAKFNGYENCIICNNKISYDITNSNRLDKLHIVACSNKCYNELKSNVYYYTYNKKTCLVCKNIFIPKQIYLLTCSDVCAKKATSNTVTEWHSTSKENDSYILRNKKIGASKLGKKLTNPVWNKNLTGQTYLQHYEKNGVNTLYQALERQKNSWYKKTSIEEKMENLLIKLKIDYQYSYFDVNKQFDFKLDIGDKKTYIIETDGDYFHRSSRRCSDESEKNMYRLMDKTKENLLINKLGIDNCFFLRFWEYNINNNIEYIEQLLFSLLKNKNKKLVIQKIKNFYLKNQ